MDRRILPPPKEIIVVADILAEAISSFLHCRDESVSSWGTYESEAESMSLFALLVRCVESIHLLAIHDLVYLPSAKTLARSSLEYSAIILWMLDPEDPLDRETRWLIHLNGEIDYLERYSTFLQDQGFDSAPVKMKATQLRGFMDSVTENLPAGYKVKGARPNLRQILDALNMELLYARYMELSQFTHGTHSATWTYRKNLGIYQELGEFISPKDWLVVFELVWLAMIKAGPKLIERLGGDGECFPEDDLQERMQDAFKVLAYQPSS